MSYELTGSVKVINEEKVFGSGFRVREFVVTVEDGKYPQDIILQFVQDKVDTLDGVSEGQEVTVTFDIRGKEHGDRYFNNLQAWKLEAIGEAPSAPEAEALDAGDDIPF